MKSSFIEQVRHLRRLRFYLLVCEKFNGEMPSLRKFIEIKDKNSLLSSVILELILAQDNNIKINAHQLKLLSSHLNVKQIARIIKTKATFNLDIGVHLNQIVRLFQEYGSKPRFIKEICSLLNISSDTLLHFEYSAIKTLFPNSFEIYNNFNRKKYVK